MKASDIWIRDPFVLPVEKEGKYYLYGTTDKNCWEGEPTGFDGYYPFSLPVEDFPLLKGHSYWISTFTAGPWTPPDP